MNTETDKTLEIVRQLSGLYQKDPVEFERISRELIRQTIASFPEHYQKRAEGLQFRIDCLLSRYTDPVARMNRMVEIFWEYFQQFHDVFHNPEKLLRERRSRREPGKLIPISRANRVAKH